MESNQKGFAIGGMIISCLGIVIGVVIVLFCGIVTTDLKEYGVTEEEMDEFTQNPEVRKLYKENKKMKPSTIELIRRYPYVLCFIIAGVGLFAGILNFHSATIVNDYIQTEGEVCNLESYETLRRGRYVTRYKYDIVWYADGEEYIKQVEGISPIEEGIYDIWVDPDNKDAVLSNATDISGEVPKDIIAALAFGIIGLVLYKRRDTEEIEESTEQKIERLENRKLYGMIGFVGSCIFILIYAGALYRMYCEEDYVKSIYFDVLIIATVIGAICFGVYFRAKKALEKM